MTISTIIIREQKPYQQIKSFWMGDNPLQKKYNKLCKLIPDRNAVPYGDGINKHLELLRQAANCYYDLYNNGLCNRKDEYKVLFKGVGYKLDTVKRCQRIENRMSEYVEKAFEEQFSCVSMTYIGSIEHLKGESALVKRSGDSYIAQFTKYLPIDPSQPFDEGFNSYAHNWHEFNIDDFSTKETK